LTAFIAVVWVAATFVVSFLAGIALYWLLISFLLEWVNQVFFA
jgi:hypothetical protein